LSNRQAIDPAPDCALCPRLAKFRAENQSAYPDYFNAPAPTFGSRNASLLIVGLAPGLHGANRTGRAFTGDASGDLLYATLGKFGLSNDRYESAADDGLRLKHTAITNAVRCLPPGNKPNGEEIRTCRPYLTNQIKRMNNLRAVLCLGRIAHASTLAALDIRQKDAPFSHGARHPVPATQILLFDSYHCSRYNTNTGRLTARMFEDVFATMKTCIETAPAIAAE
jgi:uracil-DNA glycosylase